MQDTWFHGGVHNDLRFTVFRMHVHAHSSLLLRFNAKFYVFEITTKVLITYFHYSCTPFDGATLPPNFAVPRDGTSLAPCARTCNVFSRVRRANRPKSRDIVAIRGLDSPSVDIPENPAKIGSSYRIGLRNVAEKNPPRISEFQLGISFHQSQKFIAARARDSVYAFQERRIDLTFF